MIIKVWDNFSKRRNSTAQPSDGITKNVYLKEETSIEKPSFILMEPIAEYTYVQAFGRYYFVTDVINLDANRCQIDCDLDVLATYKADIISYTAFVERAAASYDEWINDPLLSMQQSIRTAQTLTTSISSFFGSGCFVAEVLAKDNGMVLYATDDLTPYQHILTPGVYTNTDKQQWIQSTIAQSFDLDVYVGSVKWMPFDASDIGIADSTHFYIGPVDLAVAASPWPYTIYKVAQNDMKYKFDLSLTLPSTGLYNDFRDSNPNYTKYLLYLPGVGLVNLDTALIGYAIKNSKTVYADMLIDMVSGEITYLLRMGSDLNEFARYSGNISVDVPIGKAAVDVTKSAKMVAGSIGAGASAGGWIGAAFGAIAGGVEAIYNALTPDTNMIGGSGNKCEIYQRDNAIHLMHIQFGSKDYPTSVAGRPLMQNVTLSGLSGYVKCGNASVPLAGHEEDMAAVNNYLNSGFYIE